MWQKRHGGNARPHGSRRPTPRLKRATGLLDLINFIFDWIEKFDMYRKLSFSLSSSLFRAIGVSYSYPPLGTTPQAHPFVIPSLITSVRFFLSYTLSSISLYSYFTTTILSLFLLPNHLNIFSLVIPAMSALFLNFPYIYSFLILLKLVAQHVP